VTLSITRLTSARPILRRRPACTFRAPRRRVATPSNPAAGPGSHGAVERYLQKPSPEGRTGGHLTEYGTGTPRDGGEDGRVRATARFTASRPPGQTGHAAGEPRGGPATARHRSARAGPPCVHAHPKRAGHHGRFRSAAM